jgi:tripartite-type tricarboxylate transporter receptor subunit TctC
MTTMSRPIRRAMLARAGAAMCAPLIGRPSAQAHTALQQDTAKTLLGDLGARIIASTPEELTAHVRAEMDRWGVVIRDAGVKAEGG